ncbi:MAG TPA: dihydroorotate dehydrogenase-like protein, partial [Pirellulales bacterium]|nr:dihydroorotate dehydrogenase-like protein [Pirellulales bacterium]
RKAVKIPLAVKIGPHFTALANVARRLIDAGANGLVLFNRFLQPDIDVDTLSVMPHLTLSTRDELRLPLRWVAILRGQLTASLAATGGIHHAEDVIKALLAGADVAMVASTLYRYGIDHLKMIIDELRFWLEASEYVSLNQLRGNLSQARCADPGAFERANYTKAVSSFMTE